MHHLALVKPGHPPATLTTKCSLLSLLSSACCHALVFTQAQLNEAQKQSSSQAEQITTLREELHGSLAECDQLEARLQDRDQATASLQQLVQAGQRQQAADQQQLIASTSREGRLQGEVSTLSRCVPACLETALHAKESKCC